MPNWKRLAREPLVHFLAIGAALFVFFAWRGGSAAPNRVVVTPGRIDHLVAGFTKTWQRPPNGDELKALVDEFVREEIATREAKAMGLDADDTIIRRRLRQKLEFVVEDAAAAVPLTDDELERYLAEHPEKFQLEPRLSLRQVYVSRDRRGEAAEVDAQGILDRLRALGPDAAIEQVGDLMVRRRSISLPGPRSRVCSVSVSSMPSSSRARSLERTDRVGLRAAPGAGAERMAAAMRAAACAQVSASATAAREQPTRCTEAKRKGERGRRDRRLSDGAAGDRARFEVRGGASLR